MKRGDACLHISSSSPSILLIACPMSQVGKDPSEVGKGNNLFIYDCAKLHHCEVLPLHNESPSGEQNYEHTLNTV